MSAAPAHVARKALTSFFPAPIVAGLLMAAAFEPIGMGWLTPLAFALVLASIRLRGGEKAGRQGLVFALVWMVPSLSWISAVFAPGWLFTALWCSGYEALFAWAVGRFLVRAPAGRRWAWVALAPLAHVFADLLRTVVLTGFPWLIPGYTGWDNPVLLGSADLLGVHGLTIAWLVLGAGLAEVLARSLGAAIDSNVDPDIDSGIGPEAASDAQAAPARLSPLAPALALWLVLAGWAFGKPATPERPGPTLALLQGNVPQFIKEERVARGLTKDRKAALDQFVRDWLRTYTSLAREAAEEATRGGRTIDAVVWPETMVPATLTRESATVLGSSERNDWWWDQLAQVSRGSHTIAGIQTALLDEERAGVAIDEWNTVMLITPQGQAREFQDKQHLCPGGEYVPYLDLIPYQESFVEWLEEEAGYLPALRPGVGPNLLTLPGIDDGGSAAGETRLGVLVCYESIFPELSHAMSAAGADFILNASNYGWFAGTAQMEQALAMASIRAAELRRSFVLSSNNGISAVLGPDGSVRDVLEAPDGRTWDFEGYLLSTVPIGSGSGPYGWWGENGAWVLSGLGVLFGVFLAARAPPRKTDSQESAATESV